ncbi:MAG: hypothetical protein IT537_30595 [Hyphomicrobiales bacterium]|nr:hypothetical protein [Hyphomicrobiales bacterium]
MTNSDDQVEQQRAAERERDELHPERRKLLDKIMADFPKLTLEKALIAFKEAGG